MRWLLARTIFHVRLTTVIYVAVILGAGSVAAQSYHIRPGDILRIEVLEDPELNRSVLVTPDGRISVPMAGTMRISGQPVEAVQRGLAARLSASFANPPNVFVSVERLAERRPDMRQPTEPKLISVFVMGEANKPGHFEIPEKYQCIASLCRDGRVHQIRSDQTRPIAARGQDRAAELPTDRSRVCGRTDDIARWRRDRCTPKTSV